MGGNRPENDEIPLDLEDLQSVAAVERVPSDTLRPSKGRVEVSPAAGAASPTPSAGLIREHTLLASSRPPQFLPTIGKFGDYEIVGRLAMGGMAEILLAREDVQGRDTRYLVVKRILQQYNDDKQFIDMFLDEARIGMRLSHPNICHIYQFGQAEGSYYIAMEWVNGVALGKLIRRAKEKGAIPVEIACRVMAQVAEALDYAHRAYDADGQPLGLVHRDVSPHNIMVSYDGAVKLLDFGIAKALTQAHQTKAGTVKGKFSYMAPEQITGEGMDHRADIFSLGVCIFETFAMKPLYLRQTEIETMRAILDGPVPSLIAQVPTIPIEVEQIVRRCLQKKPEQRFQSAGEVQEALDQYIAGRQQVVSATKIAAYMHKVFHREIRRGPMVETRTFSDSYLSNPGSSSSSNEMSALKPSGSTSSAAEGSAHGKGMRELLIDQLPDAPDLELALQPRDLPAPRPTLAREATPLAMRRGSEPKHAPARTQLQPGPRGFPGWLIGAGVLLLLAVAGGVGYVVLFRTPPAPAPDPVTRPGDPGPAGGTSPTKAPGDEGAAPTETATGETGTLTLDTTPQGARLFIGGELRGTTPVDRIEVPAGVVRVELELPNGERQTHGVFVRPGAETRTHLDLTQRQR